MLSFRHTVIKNLTFSGFCSCPLAGLGLDEEPPQPDVCTAFSSCHARRASRSLWSSKQIQSGCKRKENGQPSVDANRPQNSPIGVLT